MRRACMLTSSILNLKLRVFSGCRCLRFHFYHLSSGFLSHSYIGIPYISIANAPLEYNFYRCWWSEDFQSKVWDNSLFALKTYCVSMQMHNFRLCEDYVQDFQTKWNEKRIIKCLIKIKSTISFIIMMMREESGWLLPRTSPGGPGMRAVWVGCGTAPSAPESAWACTYTHGDTQTQVNGMFAKALWQTIALNNQKCSLRTKIRFDLD